MEGKVLENLNCKSSLEKSKSSGIIVIIYNSILMLILLCGIETWSITKKGKKAEFWHEK